MTDFDRKLTGNEVISIAFETEFELEEIWPDGVPDDVTYGDAVKELHEHRYNIKHEEWGPLAMTIDAWSANHMIVEMKNGS